MSKEAIARVLRAEAEANQLRENARAEAAAKIEACEQECAKEKARKLEETAAALKTRRDMVNERATELIARSREEATGDIETLRETARSNMREAVKHIEWELSDI